MRNSKLSIKDCPGTVYWITGFSGAGKTTIGSLFHKKLLENGKSAVFLDGDTLREIFGGDLGYSVEDRKKSASRNSKLCKLLSDQGIDVVCATISMFHDSHEWNKKNIRNYKEIYLKVSKDMRAKRDSKNLYSTNNAHETNEEPKSPTVIIENEGSLSPNEIVKKLVNAFVKEEKHVA